LNKNLKSVAKLSGVSISTASLVLQSKGSISLKTRNNVLKVAKKINYTPKALKLKKTNNIVSLIVDDVSNSYFTELYDVLNIELKKQNKHLNIFSSNDSVEVQDSIIKNLVKINNAGIILVPASGTTEKNLSLFKHISPTLIIAIRNISSGSFNFVGTSPFLGVQMATEYLLKLGHKKIGFIGGNSENIAFSQRILGYKEALTKNKIEIDKSLIISGDTNVEFGRKKIKKILKSKKITAALGYNDSVAMGIIIGTEELNLKVPKDLSVIGFDNIKFGTYKKTKLTTISSAPEKLGKLIASQLVDKIDANIKNSNISSITLTPNMIIRNSCSKI
tara:strand:+ start:709 stop:1707 length:999 start_codon:yes stop_codon:yes gene_type:complete